MGETSSRESEYREGIVAPGTNLCGRDLTGMQELGTTGWSRSSTEESRIAVRPGNLVPAG